MVAVSNEYYVCAYNDEPAQVVNKLCVMNAVVCCCSRPMQRQTSSTSNPTKQLLQWAQHKTRFYDVSPCVVLHAS